MNCLKYYMDMTDTRLHSANLPSRMMLLCCGCAEVLNHAIQPMPTSRHVGAGRCDLCLREGTGEESKAATAEPTPEQMAAIDRAASAIDRFMDQLDEIANPELFKELKDTRLELATHEAELKEARQVIAARDDEIRRMRSELNGARNYADDVAGELGQMRLAMFKALTAALASGSTTPDPASPDPASVAMDPTTETGEVDEEAFWARPMSDVAYLKARKLYDAGDIAGAQLVILDDIVVTRDRSMKAGEAPTTETGVAAGKLS